MGQPTDLTAQADRRHTESSRRAADKRAQRYYDDARRRIDALEKALALIVRSMAPGEYAVDQHKFPEYRKGIDIGRGLLDKS